LAFTSRGEAARRVGVRVDLALRWLQTWIYTYPT